MRGRREIGRRKNKVTALRVLCVATYSDRPETETFIGLARAGVQLHVVSHPDAPHLWRLR